MSVRAQIENALKDALRAGNEVRKTALRMALAAIKMAEIEKRVVLDDSAVLAVLQKEVKTRREAIEDAQRAGRADLVAAAEADIGILEEFLPKAMSAEELEALVRQVIAEIGATSMKEMRQVMQALMPRLQGRATGDQASQMARKFLQ